MDQTFGEVKELPGDERTVTFEWRISDFFQLPPGPYYSPTVNYWSMDWSLEINKNWIGIRYVRLNGPPSTPEPLRFTIGCKSSHGGEGHVARDQTYPKYPRVRGRDVGGLSKTTSGDLTVTCTLREGDSPRSEGVSSVTRTKGASCSNDRKDEHVDPSFKAVSRETQTEDAGLKAISSLSEHFKNMLLSGDGHDVLIRVGDKQFRAHKHILKARSPVFAAMLSNEMAKSVVGSVTIEDCDPDAFGQFLQFVYSGKVDIATVSRALELYYAGDKYDFPRLKEICVEFLKISFTTTTVFDVISLAARHDEEELLQQAIVYFANNLDEVMLTVEWRRFLLANSVQANEMSLKAMQCLKTSLHKK